MSNAKTVDSCWIKEKIYKGYYQQPIPETIQHRKNVINFWKAQSLCRNFTTALDEHTEKSDLMNALLSVLKDDTKLGDDPAIATQSEGFVESYVGMKDYSVGAYIFFVLSYE